MKHPIGQTRNGVEVYVDLIDSQAAKHIAQQPQLLTLAKEVFTQTNIRDVEISIEHDMRRPIGYSFVVATTDADTIFYGCLLKDDIYTRFVKNGKPLATNYLTVVLLRDSNNSYELADIWIGRLRPPRPGSANETAESKSYWLTHAVVPDGLPLQQRTITKTCPY